MVYYLQSDLVYSTVARRDQILTQIQTEVASDPRWEPDGATGEAVLAVNIPLWRWEGTNPNALATMPAVRCKLYFQSKQAQERVMGRIDVLASGVRLPLDKSFVRIHDCRDDEGPDHPACPTPTRYEWVNGDLVQV